VTAAQQPQRITCPHCQASIKAPPLAPGSNVGCPRCGKSFVLGGPAPISVGTTPATSPTPSPSVATQPRQTVPQSPIPRPPPPPQAKPKPAVPDVVVDPMQQPIQRARQPQSSPLHTEFAIVCKLCGTRLHARLDQVGQQIQCPDCHSPIDVPAPPVAKAKPKGPSLDDAEDVPLSDPGDRPRYRPMVRPTGEDAILGLLSNPPFDVSKGEPPAGQPAAPRSPSSAAPAQRFASPSARASAAPSTPGSSIDIPDYGLIDDFPPIGQDPAPATDASRSAASSRPSTVPLREDRYDDEDDDDALELRLSAPVERPQMKVELPHHIAADLPDPRDEGSYGDELWGGGVDDGRPRWQKSPFLVGVFEFLFYPSTLSSWIGHSVVAGGLLCLLQLAMFYSQGGVSQVAGLLLSMLFTVLTFVWGSAFAAACLAVVQDTANGLETVGDWPDWMIFEWFGKAFTMAAAFFVAAVPGMVIGSAMLSGGGPFIAVPLPIITSLVAFFPIVLSSMLTEASIISVVSPTVIRMLRAGAEGWIVFYMLTFVQGVLAIGAIALLEMQNVIATVAAGAIGVTLILLYMRLLGRLLWYSQLKLTEAESREEARRRWAERANRA
jgi:hypothetical protein